MGGATARILTLISTPIPLLHPHRRTSLHLLRRLSSHSTPKSSPHFHTQTHPYNNNNDTPSNTIFHQPPPPPPSHSHPLPEWSRFVDRVSRSGYCNAPHFNYGFAASLESSGQAFLSAAHGCLAFAMDHPALLWSLPREDIKVVVENGTPFVFKDGESVTARMNCFLGGGDLDHVPESDKPSTVDLMKFLLSYVHAAVVSAGSTPIHSRVGSAVSTLFSELAKSGGTSAESVASVVPTQKPPAGKYGQAPRSFEKNIEMKKGDWLCPRCTFMNFAKNPKCLECEEPRPRKFLTGGEWECPQCDFYNFSRNVACLRCDCKKPEAKKILSPTTVSGLGTNFSFNNDHIEKKWAGIEGHQQPWFAKITQLEKSSDMGSSLPDEDFPETMLAGDNRVDGSNFPTPDFNSSNNVNINQSVDELLAQNSFIPDTRNEGGEFGVKSRDATSFSSASSSYSHTSEVSSSDDTASVNEQQVNEIRASQTGDRERQQAEKSERWFKKVAELHDVKDLPSAISDEDFPEIMPMRKGENRFVVSKKKDRSLTSPIHKRRVAMEQAGNSNYVPFVPFPPDYFSKDKPENRSDSTDATSVSQASVGDMSNSSDTSPYGKQQTGGRSIFSGGTRDRAEQRATNRHGTSSTADQTSKAFDSQFSNTSGGYPKTDSRSGSNLQNTSTVSSENAGFIDSWRGRTLEGSAVKETDPLDMSEEAKAERWFRRVAQIKDVSELSQIPDEDFPSIMPMRKGVNRFVVSKRKTPLERRLTSSQYRRDLPVSAGSDSVKNETDSS